MNPRVTSVSALPYPFYFYPAIFLTLLGLVDTTYLAFSHYRIYTEPAYSSFCAITNSVNCDTVSQSPWSIFFGLPISYYGFLGYALILTLLLGVRKLTQESFSLWCLILVFTVICSLVSLYLGYISATKIKAYCILCLLSYLICFSLAFLSWIIRRRFSQQSFTSGICDSMRYLRKHRKIPKVMTVFLILFGLIGIFLPRYWELTNQNISNDRLNTGVTENGSPWIGAAQPQLTIEEFSDYQCFQCYKMHFLLRALVIENPDKIRLVHHHYPLDKDFNPIVVKNEFHVGSGEMSILAIYAQTQGKFWEMNDALFKIAQSKQPFDTKQLEEEVGISSGFLVSALNEPVFRRKLDHDIKRGMKKRIISTPTFLINGELYTGNIPPELLKYAIK